MRTDNSTMCSHMTYSVTSVPVPWRLTALHRETSRMQGRRMTRYVHLALLCLTLLGGLMACAPKLAGPTAPSGYVFSLRAFPPSVVRSSPYSTTKQQTSSTLVVRVQDAQGRPIDSVPVEFQVEPSWVQDASVSDSRALTQGGKAQVRFQASTTGIVHVMVRVEHATEQVVLAVTPRGGSTTASDGG